MKPLAKRVEALKKAKAPTKREEVVSFLGAMSFLRKFIPNYATKVAKIQELVKKGKVFVWEKEHEEAS